MNVFVVIVQKKKGTVPVPFPLESGFSEDMAYRILDTHSYSETGDTQILLSNNKNELWSISNQHLRTVTFDIPKHVNKWTLSFPLTKFKDRSS